MANSDFIMAVGPDGQKRLVPTHYIDNPAFGFRLPPSARVEEPSLAPLGDVVREPAAVDATADKVEEPAVGKPKSSKRTGAAGETKEV